MTWFGTRRRSGRRITGWSRPAPGGTSRRVGSASRTVGHRVDRVGEAGVAARPASLYLATHPGDSPAQVHSAIVGDATAGVVTSPGSGSPNRLLYTGAF